MKVIDLIYDFWKTAVMAAKIPRIDPLLFQRIDLNLFKIFREIVRAEGIGAAARRLRVQQPAVSLALKRLENYIGAELCLRTSKGIELTAAGRVVATMCDHLFADVQSLPNALAEAKGEVEGTLTIRLISGVVSAELDDTLDTMRRRHPNIRLKLDVAPCRIVVDALARGQAELCIAFESAQRTDLLYEPLVREYQQLYCGPGHPLFGALVSNPERLAGERFIVTGSDEPDDVGHFRRRYGLGRVPAGEAENLEEAKRMIAVGVGIGFLPTVLMDKSADRARFWAMLPKSMLPNYCLYLITQPEAQQTLPTQLFLREIRRRLSARGVPV
jgi:DNA-binding transcriptional LysR family regulator